LIGCILLFVSIYANEAKAQRTQDVVKLTWDKQEQILTESNTAHSIPSFSGAAIDTEEGIPYYRLQFPNTVISNFQLTETTYQPFTTAEIKQLGKKAISQA